MTLRASDDDTWRDKYLAALDAHKELESEADEQFQRLRRALVQVSLAADGQDRELDRLLDELRKALRSDRRNWQLPELAEELDECIRGFEQRRETSENEIVSALSSLVKQLQALAPPRELKRELKHYQNRLPTRSQRFALFPALLSQLAELQQRAIEQTRDEKPGLLNRLRGERGGDPLSSQALSAEINQVLDSLLLAINTEYIGPETPEALQTRLKQGVSLSELPAFLEEVRDLIMHSWLAANQVFASYLNSVNRELEDISALIGGAVDREADRRSGRRVLTDQMAEQCQSIATQIESASDLNELKSRVSHHLEQIRDSLHQVQHCDEAGDGEPLAEQLEQLASRLQAMEQEAEESRVSLQRHRHKALHDPLTQLPNREAYDERLAHEVKRWERYGHPLTLAVCDVDHFKRINDRFGHQAGDRVLRVISRAIGRRLREVDFFGRYGGEEFVILMPETGAEDARNVLDDVRESLAETAFNYRKEPLAITVSFGIAQFREGDTANDVFGRADQALYAAKAAGRNQCQIG